MKKTIFAAVFAFAVIIGGHQYFKNQASDNLSGIMKANVEALADVEDDFDSCKGCSINNDGSFCCAIYYSWGYVVLRADNGFHPGEWE